MTGRSFAGICALFLASAVGASVAIILSELPATEAPLKVMLVTSGPNDYQESMMLGAQAAAQEHGIELSVHSIDELREAGLKALLERSEMKKLSGIVICQNERDPVSLARLDLPANTKVVTCGDDLSTANRLCHVGTGNYAAGTLCAKVVKQALPNGGRIVVLVDDIYRGLGAQRLSGFFSGLRRQAADNVGESSQAPRYEIVECLEDNGQPQLCAHNLRSAISRRVDVACVVDLASRRGASSITQLAAAAAARAITLVTFDQSEAALDAVETGGVYAVIGNKPFAEGYQAVSRLASFCRGEAMGLPVAGRGHVHVPASVVRRENIAESRAELAAGRRLPAA